ncbi:MAG: hypothetical protein GY749_06925 [Desulfobacteraceae bacterium]|nr:hypothetical protein [Desulfobacteraceae bacterium]
MTVYAKVKKGKLTGNPGALPCVYKKSDGRTVSGFDKASPQYAKKYGYVSAVKSDQTHDPQTQTAEAKWKLNGDKAEEEIILKDRPVSIIAGEKIRQISDICIEKIRTVYPDDNDMRYDQGIMIEFSGRELTEEEASVRKKIMQRWSEIKVLRERSDILKKYVRKLAEKEKRQEIVNVCWEAKDV